MPLYALGPLEGLRIRRLIGQVDRYEVPERKAQAIDFTPHPIEAEPYEAFASEESADTSGELVGVGPS
jgi:hypothetical protein